ncbi:hypothetical protein Celaphus_00013681 [Cervus elaphus hippelaphus]|uniref:Uncharacterized protein n=1 Tax=Cervus elaphus hippelaphus TaxID=46360 RepID=A0A212CD00_CEREH|nr:hypothetical protein Celaphus_00013681 [Cervus elaphus hippelaphus]
MGGGSDVFGEQIPSPRCSGSSPWGGRRVGTCQLAAGTCEIVTLDRDSSQPRRTIARQTARCACRKGQIAGTTRARPACVDGRSAQASCSLDRPPAHQTGPPAGLCQAPQAQ